ncbi:hypothetical protein CEP53_011048 [Fusarium sp. AF-6]|nr:hypothetical protein CEP53_011048 [Fusarium sp. AF-6]
MARVPEKRPHSPKCRTGLMKKTKLSHHNSGEVTSESGHRRRAQDEPVLDAGPSYGDSISEPIYIPSSDEDEELPPPKTLATNTHGAPASQPTSKATALGPALSRATTPARPYDVCFGMLLVQATCTENAIVPSECSPVTLGFEGRLLRVYSKESSERIAVVLSHALFRVVNEFAVTLTATACGRKQRVFDVKEASERAVAKISGMNVCSLRIICYGFLQQRHDVADILAKGDLFLQHPGPTEVDRAVKYLNPQYLLPPGEDFPDIESLSIYGCCAGRGARSGVSRDELGEQEQSQIFKIFNTAYESDGVMATIEPSPRLMTKLKRHQIEALVMMVEKEAGVNRSSKIFQDVCKLQAESRWCLTGTPIQNYLDDFGSLLSFIRVPPFETKDQFDSHIAEPVKQRKSQGLEMLRKVVAATCLRRTKADHAKMLNLPRKMEHVERIEMSRNDRRLYEFFKRFSYLTAGLDKTSKKRAATNILVLISMLRLICDHGEAMLPDSALTAWKNRDKNALTWEMLESTTKRCVSCDCQIEELGAAESLTEALGCSHVLCGDCAAKLRGSASQLPCPKCGTTAPRSPSAGNNSGLPLSQTAFASPLRPRYPPSAKVEALLRNISERQKRPGYEGKPNKSVIFSFWTKMLDLIGAALEDEDMKFCRIDGQSSMPQRKQALETFGNDPECNIMLASIGAVGEGIDLVSANSVHIIEPHWNPMAEAQAIDRVHRIGQQQDVDVVRYIVNDSIELVMPPVFRALH